MKIDLFNRQEFDKQYGKTLFKHLLDLILIDKRTRYAKYINNYPSKIVDGIYFFNRTGPRFLVFLSISYAYYSDNCLSIAEISQATTLTRQTVSTIKGDLVDLGYIDYDFKSFGKEHYVKTRRLYPTALLIAIISAFKQARSTYYNESPFSRVQAVQKAIDNYEKMS
ncbi:MAG: hypothetical protein GOVbin1230_12 [Prokaryotic dsDNA virus sp.]|nr:MAG: hypothetical protein GOVbin1230_12 [Prokaryotic dsDNA virus sp.]|tara:strand:+ start:42 stop:542 length:501 start_codon:yes stop_codon:yes gene_type:complete